MVNVKISALPAATTLAGTEPIPIVQSGSTVKATAQAIANLAPVSVTDAGSGRVVVTPSPGTAAFTLDLNVGTGANQIVALNGSAKLPVVDGSQLTNLSGGNLTSGTVAYTAVQNESTVTLLGNPTGAPASPSEVTLGTGLAFVGSVLTPAQTAARTALGPGTTVLNFTAAFGAIAALTGTAVTQAVTGLLTTDQCHVECVSSPPSGYNHPNARCSTNGTLELFFTTAVAVGITLGSLNYRLTVVR